MLVKVREDAIGKLHVYLRHGQAACRADLHRWLIKLRSAWYADLQNYLFLASRASRREAYRWHGQVSMPSCSYKPSGCLSHRVLTVVAAKDVNISQASRNEVDLARRGRGSLYAGAIAQVGPFRRRRVELEKVVEVSPCFVSSASAYHACPYHDPYLPSGRSLLLVSDSKIDASSREKQRSIDI